MTERRYREITTLLCFLAMSFVWLPSISSYAIHENTMWELIVRGFNLIEFSRCGWVVLLAPLFWIMLVYAPIPPRGKKVLFYVSSVVAVFCFIVSTNKAIQWLDIHGNTAIEYRINFFSLLAAYLAVMLWGTVGKPKEFECESPDGIDEDEFY